MRNSSDAEPIQQSIWFDFFANWPNNFSRKGVVISTTDEQIPFSDFVMNRQFLILERPTPDVNGGRRVAIPLAGVAAVKYTEPLKTEQFLDAGYTRAATPQASTQRLAPTTTNSGAK